MIDESLMLDIWSANTKQIGRLKEIWNINNQSVFFLFCLVLFFFNEKLGFHVILLLAYHCRNLKNWSTRRILSDLRVSKTKLLFLSLKIWIDLFSVNSSNHNEPIPSNLCVCVGGSSLQSYLHMLIFITLSRFNHLYSLWTKTSIIS